MWTKLRVRFLKTFRSFSFLEFCSVLNFDITALRDILVCHEAVTIFIYFMNYLTYNRISNGAANRRLPFQIVYSQKSGKLGEVAMSMFLRCGRFSTIFVALQAQCSYFPRFCRIAREKFRANLIGFDCFEIFRDFKFKHKARFQKIFECFYKEKFALGLRPHPLIG